MFFSHGRKSKALGGQLTCIVFIYVVTELPIWQNFKFCQQNFQLEVLSTELPIWSSVDRISNSVGRIWNSVSIFGQNFQLKFCWQNFKSNFVPQSNIPFLIISVQLLLFICFFNYILLLEFNIQIYIYEINLYIWIVTHWTFTSERIKHTTICVIMFRITWA